jgi:hypothetical protein
MLHLAGTVPAASLHGRGNPTNRPFARPAELLESERSPRTLSNRDPHTMYAVADSSSLADPEPLVDAIQLAAHLHFDVRLIRKLARQSLIPALDYENGGRHYYRLHISEVEAALRARA